MKANGNATTGPRTPVNSIARWNGLTTVIGQSPAHYRITAALEGKYQLERAIGRGGMGVVFEATDLRLRRQVAAKVMMGSLFGDQSALRRFEREARAAVDARADIFAIGVMLVESLTGTRPFSGRTAQEVITSLFQTDYHLPGQSAEARALDAIVRRCLAKDPR